LSVDKQNILLSNTAENFPYAASGRRDKPNIPKRDPARHAAFLQRKFDEAYKQNKLLKPEQVAAIQMKEGIYLEFSGQANCELIAKSLENVPSGIRLLNLQEDENNIEKALVYVPKDKSRLLLNKIRQYAESAGVKNAKLLNSIDDIHLAVLDSFWTGKKDSIPDKRQVWCEIWLRVDGEAYEKTESAFRAACSSLKIKTKKGSVKFPERMVMLALANREKLANLLICCEFMAEIRRAEEPNNFFTGLMPAEQREWADSLLSRTDFNLTDTSICILDTGINNGHPLLDKACVDKDVQAVKNVWGTNDHEGHGTEMAGIALYFDLKSRLLTKGENHIAHHIESVKILPPKGKNLPDLYGAITQDAIYLAESEKAQYHRVICMAVTESKKSSELDGHPSSWSGAIDSIVSGAFDEAKKRTHRLFFISAGNVSLSELTAGYPSANLQSPVESPGQAWNAITVGAYSNNVQIDDSAFAAYRPVAEKGDLSPISTTSVIWKNKWPIKPEILCDGGNIATDGKFYSSCEDLSLLTTSHRITERMFSTINGTSAATAQAAWMAAQIMSEYPDIWPETVRALLIHSARWTPEMKKRFLGKSYEATDILKRQKRNLLRTCGYGVPDLEKAIQCLSNSVNMIIEDDMQPFINRSNRCATNEMRLHKLPWPKNLLLELGETSVELRVTLSYFIEPGPGEIGWKDKYRYPSCGLRFDVINSDESKEDFLKRVNVKVRGEDAKDKGEGTSGSDKWYIGSNNRDVGSIHSDYREQTAAELANAEYIAVYPVVGWWRERSHLRRVNSRLRYSLIVTISTPRADVDLYTPIITQIETEFKVPVEIEIPK
jgi:hypothetical protein